MDKKTIFKQAEIIDLKYFPIRKRAAVEEEMLDYVSNAIIKFGKYKRRIKQSSYEPKKFNFDYSDTLLAIDVSTFGSMESTYLQYLSSLFHLYPLICINCDIDHSQLKNLSIHKILNKNGYLLPFLPAINPTDNLYTAKRYGPELLKLFSGEISKLPIESIGKLDYLFSLDDLLNRYKNLSYHDGYLYYDLNIVWLGVIDSEINSILNDLFNNGTNNFSLNELITSRKFDENEFRHFLKKSYFFDYNSDSDTYTFRFTRREILLNLKLSLMQQFENKLYEYSVIDTTYTDYDDLEKSFIEYHDIGKIFKSDDSYSYKLISPIKKLIAANSYDRIILVDNGFEDNLKELLDSFSIPVSRILNNSGKPQLYPFDKLNQKQYLLVVIDLCNKGNFLIEILKFLVDKYESNNIDIFSFVINTEFNFKSIKNTRSRLKNISINYYIEKELHEVDRINVERQQIRRKTQNDERYIFFWQTVNSLGTIERKLKNSGLRPNETFTETKMIESIFLQSIHFREYAERDQSVDKYEDLYSYLFEIISKHAISHSIQNQTPSSKRFAKIIKKINEKIKICYIDFSQSNIKIPEEIGNDASILIYDDGLNSGFNISRVVEELKQSQILRICAFVLFSRKNAIKRSKVISDRLLNDIRNSIPDLYTYYESDLPYYLLNTEEKSDDLIFKKFLTMNY